MRKILYVIGTIIAVVLIKSNFKVAFDSAPPSAIASTKSVVIKADNSLTRAKDAVQMSLPSGWQTKLSARDPKQFVLGASNPSKDLHLLVVTYPKDTKEITSLEQVAELSSKGSNTLDRSKIETMKIKQVGDYRAIQQKVTGTTRSSKVKSVFLVTAIEAPNAYYDIIMIAPAATFPTHQMELQLAIQSFREIVHPTAAKGFRE